MEKDAILNQEMEDFKSSANSKPVQRPSSVFIRFLRNMKNVLMNMAPKHPQNCRAFFYCFRDLLALSGEDIMNGVTEPDRESDAYKIGMKAFYNEKMLESLGHFMLQDKSPCNTIAKVNIQGPRLEKGPFLAVIILMINEDRQEWRKEFSPEESAIIGCNEIMS